MTKKKTNKSEFGSKLGLIAATVGSAVGLGTIWRFPAEAQANGGAAFLLVYIGCVALLGIPVMLGEFCMGRGTGMDAIGAFRKLRPRTAWWLTGALAVVTSLLVLSFYMVVAGWTLEYFIHSLTGSLYEGDATVLKERMNEYLNGTWEPLGATYAMIAATFLILMMGVKKGIEKMSNILMPLLFLLLLGFACVAMTFPKAADGLAYFLYPDFSKITPRVIINALGQTFFSLSLGVGILITYASYFPKKTKLVNTSVTVSSMVLLVALLMGFIIFPAVMSFGVGGDGVEGTTLVFLTLPEVFVQLPATRFWSSLFFLLLMVAALTSTISMGEVSVAFVEKHFSLSRVKACLCVMIPLAMLSTLCCLSRGPLSGLQIMGKNIFDFLDSGATNFLLPMSALLTCIFIGWCLPGDFIKKELSNRGRFVSKAYAPVAFLIKWVCPVLIAVILVSSL